MKKEEIKKMILDNMRQSVRNPNGTYDQLSFLTTTTVTGSAFFELKEPIVLRNSFKKKIENYLLLAVVQCGMIYGFFKYSPIKELWSWLVVGLLIAAAILYFIRFFENKLIIEISSKGLTIDENIFNKWSDIEYLYFKMKYVGDGEFDGAFLVERLKNGYEHEVLIKDLSWSTNELGTMLYKCIKRYS